MAAFIGSCWTCRVVSRRSFHCPCCKQERDGEERSVQRWLALLGRSAFKLGKPVPYSLCGSCGRAYALQDDDEDEDKGVGAGSGIARVLSEDERAVLAVVAAAIFSDSSVRPEEKRAARSVIRRYTGRDMDAAHVRELLRTARSRWGDPVERLRRLACLLDEAAKRRIVAAAYLVSGADSELHAEESRLMMRLGEALELTPRAVRAAIREARTDDG